MQSKVNKETIKVKKVSKILAQFKKKQYLCARFRYDSCDYEHREPKMADQR